MSDPKMTVGSVTFGPAYTLQALPKGAWPEREQAFRDAGVEQLKAEVAELRRLLAAAGWRPIGTAPRDGTPILLFARAVHATASIRIVGWWLPSEGRWIEAAFSNPAGLVPTHWMPLPKPPTDGGAP